MAVQIIVLKAKSGIVVCNEEYSSRKWVTVGNSKSGKFLAMQAPRARIGWGVRESDRWLAPAAARE